MCDLEATISFCIVGLSQPAGRHHHSGGGGEKPMRHVEIAGTHEELGRAYGEYVAEHKLNWWWREPSPAKLEFVRACEETIAEYAPGFLEELRALAEANDADYDVVLSNMIVSDWLEFPMCNVLAVSGSRTASGRTIFIRNHDWADEDIEYVTCFRTAPKNGLRHIAFGFADPGRYDGVNEAGLAIGGSSIPFYNGKLKPGLRSSVVSRWILDTCPDVMSAVEFLKRIPHMEPNAWMLADRSGLVARVEVTPDGPIDVTSTENGMLATVNRFQSETLAPFDHVPDGNNWIYEFQRRIEAWYEANRWRIDLEMALAFASDHNAGLCNHGEPNVRYGTIYSWVGELGTDELHVVLGRPCENEYELYRLDTAAGHEHSG